MADSFAKQLADRVVADLPTTGQQTLDAQVPALVVETHSPLLAREVVSHPFAPKGDGGKSSTSWVLEELRPKVTAIGPDGRPWKSWAPFGEPGTPRVGRLELQLFGGLFLGASAAFGLGWLFGRRRGRR
jgi:hypothetical protein